MPDELFGFLNSFASFFVYTVSATTFSSTVRSGKIDPTRLITHHFKFEQILEAYETFGNAAKTRALKVIIDIK